MTLMYYFILAFGAILFLYTAQGWRKTRRKIHPHDVSLDKTKNRIAEIKKKIQLWQYYFVGGDRKKLARNIFISCAIFLILFFIN
ncbi:protein TadB, partial [Pasteurella multocida 93002]